MEASDHFAYCSEIWADPKYTIVLEQRGRIMVMQVKFLEKKNERKHKTVKLQGNLHMNCRDDAFRPD